MENIEEQLEARYNLSIFKAKLTAILDELKCELRENRQLKAAIEQTMQSKIDNISMKIRIYTEELAKVEREARETRVS